ncbi:hypothetical protein PMIT1342_00468 [Prochlorococcus marinus str. MIT 1342]|uniref:hypothetical protein n=1 Tax=Prochlorococcus TaxID=1218 RepID=UPI0007B366D6|nr:hypothetical protein [Prochlorococcus marinus]KZR83109.1 hypothetical protein PMIT1342_00468 [Prochlorococcus marinus str. MIT 1342]
MQEPTALRRDLVQGFYSLIYENVVNVFEPLIRLGGNNDGGYLCPGSLIAGSSACFSPGVATMCDFDLDYVRIFKKPLYAIDGTVDALAGSDEYQDLIFFEKAWLGSRAFPDGEKWYSLQEWVNACVGTSQDNLILQMDIEGHEWGLFKSEDMYFMRRFDLIMVEIHDLRYINTDEGFGFFSAILARLMSVFGVLHVHPNNNTVYYADGLNVYPECMELTLVNLYTVPHVKAPVNLADGFQRHALDFPCVKDRDEIQMPVFT